jgi:hypothetical protein
MAAAGEIKGPRNAPMAEDAIVERFDAAWRTGSNPPRIEAFLALGAVGAETSLLIALVKIDLEYRWRKPPQSGAGSLPGRPRLEDYQALFPGLTPGGCWPGELIGEEYLIRHWLGDRPTRADYQRRFRLSAAAAAALFDPIDRELTTVAPTAITAAPSAPDHGPAYLSVADFLKAAQQSRLLVAAQIVPLQQGGFSDATALAGHLVSLGSLTSLQAEFLLKGRGTDLVMGPYLLMDRLGQGWSSYVFRARHTLLNRVVALKVIRKELIAELGPDLGRRFFQEMQAIGRMSHRNVVAAYDAGPIGDTFFLAMEYVEGMDLASVVARDGPLDAGKACAYIREAALGLQHAHDCGLVHRDLKPSNLLLCDGPRATVKILDLGLARLHLTETGRSQSHLTCGGDLLGTPDYMAPEQAEDPHQADVRADIYSLGCTLHFLLTGQPPFAGGSIMQKLKRHREEEPPRLEAAQPTIPPVVAQVVRRCLAKRPEDRFGTPAELALALEAARTHGPGRWWLLGAAGGAVAAAAVAAIVLWISLRLTPTPTKTEDETKMARPQPVREVSIADAGFSNPNVVGDGGFVYAPIGTPWTFAGNSGIQADGSAFGAPHAPDGDGRAAFLQGNPHERQGFLGVISQSLYLVPGTYTVSFQAARRLNQVQPIQFSVDGRNVGRTIVPAHEGWAFYTTSPFTIRTVGSHTIQFAATANNGDNTAFIDGVSIAIDGKKARR